MLGAENMGLVIILCLFIIASVLGALLAKSVEKYKGRKLRYGEIEFYVGIPIGIAVLLLIFVMNTMK